MSADASDITVAVATCGRPQALQRCLHAIAAGATTPRAVIVVDQSPSPRARGVALTVPQLDVRYLEQPRLGLSASRNLALTTATTRLLAVTDDDCAPLPDWVDAIRAAFAREPAPAAVTGPIVPLGAQPPGMYAISLRAHQSPRDHAGRMLPWNAGSGANFAAPVALLDEQGGWDERLGVGSGGRAAEDSDLLYRILRSGGVVRYEPTAVVAHEWQTWERRLQTRSSYGYGIGALCGIWLRQGDPFALRMAAAYARLHGRRLAAATLKRERRSAQEHARALRALPAGLLYGITASRRSPGRDLT